MSRSSLRAKPLVAALTLACGCAHAATDASEMHKVPLRTALTANPLIGRNGPAQLRQQLRSLGQIAHVNPPRPTATFVVTNCADNGSPDTLRALIIGAADGDTVDLSGLSCSTITLTNGAIPVLQDDLTLIGPGATRLAIDGNNADRVFVHSGSGTLTLSDLTIRHGNNQVSGFNIAGGACIASYGYVALDQSTVTSCRASGEGVYGGGIFAYSLTMVQSTLSSNIAYGVNELAGTAAFGGGAFVYVSGLTDSTISGNSATHDLTDGMPSYDIGGGMISILGTAISGSTIDNNYSYGFGGGVTTFSDITVSNSTLSGNTAHMHTGGGLHVRALANITLSNNTLAANYAREGGGGIYMQLCSQNPLVQSTLIASNTASPGHAADMLSPSACTLTGANNLIRVVGPTINLPGGTLQSDPRLQPLANNGGPTRTQALAPGSPAIDAGNNLAGLATDQRGAGFTRVVGVAADIGAFEVQANLPPVTVPSVSAWLLSVLAVLLGWFGGVATRLREASKCTSTS